MGRSRAQRGFAAPKRPCAQCGELYEAVQEFRGYARKFCSIACTAAANSARATGRYPPRDEIERLYCEEGLSDRALGERFGHSYQWAFKVRRFYGIAASRKPERPLARYATSHGYIRIGDEYEHRLVAEAKVGRPLRKGEVVHHIDGDKRNNDPDNLEIYPSHSEHFRANHVRPRKPRTKADHSVYRHFSLKLKGETECRCCGQPARDLHHAIPRSMHRPSRTELLNGLPLCRRCHQGWHHRKVTLYREFFRPEEWAYVSSVQLIGQSIEAWLDDRYPSMQQERDAA